MALYRNQSPFNSAVSALQGAANTTAGMTRETKTEYKPPEKTFGDALASGLGGAWSGMEIADYMNPGTTKSLFHGVGGLFKGAGAGGTAEAAGVLAGSTALPAAQALTTGGATLGGLAGAGMGTAGALEAGGISGGVAGALGSIPGVAALGETAGSAAAASSAAAGAASGAATGAEAGTAAGPVGAGVGALVGLAAGLLSYYL